MAQSLARILVHLIFSTKRRKRFITPAVREELHAYLVGTLRNHESPALLVNSVEDHVHILFSLSKNYALIKIVEEVKKGSSKWIKTKSPAFHGFQPPHLLRSETSTKERPTYKQARGGAGENLFCGLTFAAVSPYNDAVVAGRSPWATNVQVMGWSHCGAATASR